MTAPLRVGTRTSPLARAQTSLVIAALRAHHPDLLVEPVPMTTAGDRASNARLDLDFTDRIDEALEGGEIEMAVHSAKDLPGRPTRGVVVAAFPRRADPRDALVLAHKGTLRSLRVGARIGSSSARRRAMLLRGRPDLMIVPIRGNVGTRLGKIRSQGLDGVMLACAGLDRLGWSARIAERLSIARILPAPGQGALAVSVRAGDRALEAMVRSIDHPPTRAAVACERAALAALGGDCDLPFGAFSRASRGRLRLRAALLSEDGRRYRLLRCEGRSTDAARLGRSAGIELRRTLEEVQGAGP